MSRIKLFKKVQVWIYDERTGHVLLLHTNKARGEFWQPVTGGVEKGESYLTAALREAREETALPFRSKPKRLNYEFQFSRRGHMVNERCFSLKAPASALSHVTIDPHEHDDFRWVTVARAQKLLKFASNKDALRLLCLA